MTTESDVHPSRSGTKTYRGRSLDEILPQIRAELGADAVILREREGLVGGVGGFFAQRFVEVEARRGDGQSIDVYDDGPEPELGYVASSSGLEVLGLGPSGALDADAGTITIRKQRAGGDELKAIGEAMAGPSGEPQDETPAQARLPVPAVPPEQAQPSAPAVTDPREPRPFIPPSVHVPRDTAPAPQQPVNESPPVPRRFETGLFMERLREASAMLPEEAPEQVPPDPLADLAADIDADEAVSALLRAAQEASGLRPPGAAQGRPAPSRPAPSRPAPSRPAPSRPGPSRPTPQTPQAQRTPGPRTTPGRPPANRPTPDRSTARRSTPGRPAANRPTPERPPPRPKSLRDGPGAPSPRRGQPAAAQREPASAERAPLSPSEQWLPATLGRLFTRRQSLVLRPAPPQPLDATAAAAVATGLVRRGASQTWTDELVRTVGAHGTPLTEDLRAAAEAELARRIVPAPALPAAGAAVAFIGAGGSGKTRCTAAMASAYRRSSTLTVTVVALDNPDGARELSELLKDDGVPVLALSGEQAKQAVAGGRHGGLVIVDTPAATPTDPAALESLRARLAPLELDATYVALPATLAPNVATRALASFGALHPAAVTITHVDETDQLAVVMEIAMANRIPLAHFHAGTDHRRALSAINPAAIARELLP